MYSARLRALVREIDPSITEGVYAMFPGPQYETPAEVRMAGVLGADLVGMSTVLEAIAAHAEGCEVLGMSLVTNLAAGLGDPLDHEEVLAAGKAAATRMGALLGRADPAAMSCDRSRSPARPGRSAPTLRERLPDLGWTVRGFDRAAEPDGIVGDITSRPTWTPSLRRRRRGRALAGQPTEAPWPVIRDANIDGTFQVFEAARRAGVRRVVYASSNHAVGFTPGRGRTCRPTSPPRPDTLYGVSKVFGEALGPLLRRPVRHAGRVPAHRHVRAERRRTCGRCRPGSRPADCARLVDACLRSRRTSSYAIVWGVSANTRRTWSLDAGHALGLRARGRRRGASPARCRTRSRTRPTRSSAAGSPPPGFGIDEVAARCRDDLRDDGRGLDRRRRRPGRRGRAAGAARRRTTTAELADRFSGPLTFGTAGLRGPLRAGPNGMNRTVVRRAAAGLAAWLTAQGHSGQPVVVGYDARHGSADFARDSAAIFAAAGFDARLLPRAAADAGARVRRAAPRRGRRRRW